jgi:hypothetical protein
VSDPEGEMPDGPEGGEQGSTDPNNRWHSERELEESDQIRNLDQDQPLVSDLDTIRALAAIDPQVAIGPLGSFYGSVLGLGRQPLITAPATVQKRLMLELNKFIGDFERGYPGESIGDIERYFDILSTSLDILVPLQAEELVALDKACWGTSGFLSAQCFRARAEYQLLDEGGQRERYEDEEGYAGDPLWTAILTVEGVRANSCISGPIGEVFSTHAWMALTASPNAASVARTAFDLIACFMELRRSYPTEFAHLIEEICAASDPKLSLESADLCALVVELLGPPPKSEA